MKQREGGPRALYFTALISLVFVAFPQLALAARLFVSPTTGSYAIGQEIVVSVRIDTSSQAANAIEGALSFNPSLLRVKSVSSSNGIFDLEVRKPSFSNSAGTVEWAGIVLNPGYTGSSGRILTITFSALAAGSAEVTLSSGSILANDGKGTSILSGLQGARFVINTPVKPSESEKDASVHVDAQPRDTLMVTSTTHPDPARWYSANALAVAWQLPSDAVAVAYELNQKSSSELQQQDLGLVSSAYITNIPDGVSYFHLRVKTSEGWLPTIHMPVRVDTKAPAGFQITRVDSDSTNPRPQLAFSSQDAESGIAQYMMKVGDGSWTPIAPTPKDGIVAMPLQMPGTHFVTIDAIDGAGNSTRALTSVTVASIKSPVIESVSSRVESGGLLRISGRAEPRTRITLTMDKSYYILGAYILEANSSVSDSKVIFETQSDQTGGWEVSLGPVPDGRYRVRAVATDERLAVSYPSNETYILVGSMFSAIATSIQRIAIEYISWVVVAILVLTNAVAFVKLQRKRKLHKHVGRHEYILGIEEEIVRLESLAKLRALSPQEQYVRRHMLELVKFVRLIDSSPDKQLSPDKRRKSR